MFAFWIAASLLSALVAGLVLHRAAAAARAPEAAEATLPLYRRQLREIDELAERGLLAPSERRSAHAEAARRLLSAADAGGQAWTADPRGRRLALGLAAAAPLLALGLYLLVGAPGYGDQPYARRLAEWRATPPTQLDPTRMAAVLRSVAAEQPDDPEPYRFLAIAEMASGDPAAATRALRRAVSLAPQRADLWEALGEAAVLKSEGQVTPYAQAVFQEALKLDPASPTARFHLARGRIEAGETEEGLAEWRALRADLAADDPRRAALDAAIAEAEQGPAPAPAMPDIGAMVEGLAARLAADPDDPEGWVRLVRSYAVLGQDARRDAALASARARYADNPEILSRLAEAARAEPMR
ncbi:MAG: c-type cytochrome biogenesis protein CcmI [Phenylobacterium sp.]|uniref:c-type cytochrome biogenesis protein CcmI n=1 Tax=Phenylobacterium sp. TaxID=1871053 RepID=UPI00391CC202